MSAQHTPGRWRVTAGANPREKGIHDASFGHYGVTFATVSFECEYSHMPEYGAKLAAEYADRIVAALSRDVSEDMVDRIMARIDAYASSFHVDAVTEITSPDTAKHREAIRAAIAKATGSAP